MTSSRPNFNAPPAPPSWPIDDYSKDAGCVAATSVRASYVEPILKQHTFPSADDGCRWAGAATSIALVHVGKTGGESLVNMLQGAGVAFNWIHDPGAVMIFDDPHCDPAEECWWPPQVALACEHTHYIITTRDVRRRCRCHCSHTTRPTQRRAALLAKQISLRARHSLAPSVTPSDSHPRSVHTHKRARQPM